MKAWETERKMGLYRDREEGSQGLARDVRYLGFTCNCRLLSAPNKQPTLIFGRVRLNQDSRAARTTGAFGVERIRKVYC